MALYAAREHLPIVPQLQESAPKPSDTYLRFMSKRMSEIGI